jgi:hypothetical protein
VSRQGKYGVAPAAERTSRDGVVFDSKGELARWEELRLLERAGEVSELRRQVGYPLVVNGVNLGSYEADFVYVKMVPLQWPEGLKVPRDARLLPTTIVEDFKGFRTPVYRLKAKLMLAIYGIQIHETGAPQRRPRRKKAR